MDMSVPFLSKVFVCFEKMMCVPFSPHSNIFLKQQEKRDKTL